MACQVLCFKPTSVQSGSISEMGKAWQVPVLVDSPNVHPCFMCAKSQLFCRKKYPEGKIKIVTLADTWYLICTVKVVLCV